MRNEICLALMQSVVDLEEDLIVLFYNNEPILINKAFGKFFVVSSAEEYKKEFGSFANNFVPHPSYFHAEKITKNENWFDAILKLPEIQRVVSMMTPNYEPYAFSVHVEKVQEYVIGVFTNITQSLIKRIMIENNTSIDKQSGAYAKNYFLNILTSYQEAVEFGKKTVCAILIKMDKTEENNIVELANYFKNKIRQDDMLIRWSSNSFLLVSLVDAKVNAKKIVEKLHKDDCTLSMITQKENESIKELIERVEV